MFRDLENPGSLRGARPSPPLRRRQHLYSAYPLLGSVFVEDDYFTLHPSTEDSFDSFDCRSYCSYSTCSTVLASRPPD